jgi:diguanylate cyclase (GGDEF)-like protein/PAS domain S-box-containing protein
MRNADMSNRLFQQLTLDELRHYTSDLEQAIEHHAHWISQINRTLICQLPPDASDIAEHPHHLCKFGRWYHSMDNPAITTLESFRAIEPIHRQVHRAAKQLLISRNNSKELTPLYDELLAQAELLRRQLNHFLRELNQNRDIIARLMSKVFENAREGVMITTPDTTIISINAAFSEMTGYSEEEVIGKDPSLLRSMRQDDIFYAHMWQELQRFGTWQGEIWNRHRDGHDYLEWLSITAVKNDHGEVSHYVAVYSNITTASENEERLRYLAHYDQLTGLPNRILFSDRLQQAIVHANRNRLQVAVMFLDLDGFKAVNDTLGHHSGDEMLRQVAQRLTTCVRATDTVSRFGGDEFTIVIVALEGTDDVVRVAKKINQEVARPYEIDGATASITTSIGISFYPADGKEPGQLIQYADNAMYHAKRHGKNHHEFYSDI